MIIGQVVGSLWSADQDPGFAGQQLRLVVPHDPRDGKVEGNTVLAVDLVGSRQGDTVLIVYEGSSSRLCLCSESTPAEAVIVGIVDRMDLVGG